MAGAIASVYKFDGMVRALYIYETVWTPLIVMKCCKCIMWEDTNEHDKLGTHDDIPIHGPWYIFAFVHS